LEEIIKLVFLSLIGVVAGFMNVSAGGGSLLALPFLIFLGLPPAVANGTNRIAILIQNISATTRFHQLKVIPKETILLAAPPAILGSILGAQLAVNIDEMLFKKMLAVVMLLVMGFMFFGPKQKPVEEMILTTKKKLFIPPVFFLIGIYGGFIQGGIGFLLITVLTLVGYDLVRTNALKVLIVLLFTPFALAIFILNNQVDYLYGFILAAGNATGAWLASSVVVAAACSAQHSVTRKVMVPTGISVASLANSEASGWPGGWAMPSPCAAATSSLESSQ